MIFDWKYDDAMLMLQNVEMQLFSLLDVDYQIIIVTILVQSMAWCSDMIQSEDLFQRKILDFVELRGSSLNHRIIGGQRQRQHSMGGREDAVAMIQYNTIVHIFFLNAVATTL